MPGEFIAGSSYESAPAVSRVQYSVGEKKQINGTSATRGFQNNSNNLQCCFTKALQRYTASLRKYPCRSTQYAFKWQHKGLTLACCWVTDGITYKLVISWQDPSLTKFTISSVRIDSQCWLTLVNSDIKICWDTNPLDKPKYQSSLYIGNTVNKLKLCK